MTLSNDSKYKIGTDLIDDNVPEVHYQIFLLTEVPLVYQVHFFAKTQSTSQTSNSEYVQQSKNLSKCALKVMKNIK